MAVIQFTKISNSSRFLFSGILLCQCQLNKVYIWRVSSLNLVSSSNSVHIWRVVSLNSVHIKGQQFEFDLYMKGQQFEFDLYMKGQQFEFGSHIKLEFWRWGLPEQVLKKILSLIPKACLPIPFSEKRYQNQSEVEIFQNFQKWSKGRHMQSCRSILG